MAEPRIAAQLYTLRDFLKTPEAIKEALPKVRDLGYRAVQLSALGPIDPGVLRGLCDANGLDIIATHVGLDAILDDTETIVNNHETWGCRHVGIGGLGFGGLHEQGKLGEAVSKLSQAAAKLADHDLTFSYHNHSHEFERYGDKVLLQHFLDECDERVCFEIDTYWVQAGGADPAQWIEKVSGRCPILHYKDAAVVGREMKFAPVGAGNLNWEAVNAAARAAGAEYVIVEQDRCEIEPTDPFEALGVSFNNLVGMGFAV